MKRLIGYPIIIGLVYGCALLSNDGLVDPEFKKYVNEYKNATKTYKKTSVKFANLKKTEEYSILGLCNPFTGNVLIDRTEWVRLYNIEKRLLIYHELGHCLHRKSHDDRLREVSLCPVSIMHPTFPPRRCVNIFYENYLQEIENW